MDKQIISKLIYVPAVEQSIDQKDLEYRVKRAIMVLPSRCKEIFYMNKFHHYSVDEIAVHFNISPRTVHNQISLALKHLKTVLGQPVSIIILLSMF